MCVCMRVCATEASDAEEEEDVEEVPSPRSPSPPPSSSEDESPEPVKEVVASSTRGKKRKQVDKTFEDEEGYIGA